MEYNKIKMTFNNYTQKARLTLLNIHREEVEVNIHQCRIEPEVNNCFSIIFRAEQRGLQNNGLNIKTQTQLFICIHVCSRSVNNKLSCTSIVNQFTHPVS